MKVGVLTFHRSTNFGTMLQAHATVKAIEAVGAEAEIIDYRPEYIEKTFRKKREIKTPNQLLSVIYNNVIFGNAPSRKLDHFMEYIGNLKMSSHSCFSILRQITEILKRQTGLPVVNIKPSKRQMIAHEGMNLPDLGPGEFLNCYAGARYVVTNSFHGTAFAVNYGKPVYVSPLPVSMAGEVNSRLVDLLETFGISDRWIDTQEKTISINSNETMNVSAALNENREASKKILRNMIYGEDA